MTSDPKEALERLKEDALERLKKNARERIAKVIELEEAGVCSRDTLDIARSDRDRALIALGRKALSAGKGAGNGDNPSNSRIGTVIEDAHRRRVDREALIAEREGLERKLERLLRSTRGDEGGIWPLEVRDAIDALEEEHGISLCSSSFAEKHNRLREAAEAKLSALEEACKPFAAIQPSSFYPADGSDEEPYSITLHDGLPETHDLTGADLARLRALLHPTVPVETTRQLSGDPGQLEGSTPVAPPSQGMETLVENANARIAKVWDLEEKGTCSLGTLQVARSDRDRALIALGRQALAALQSHKGGEGDSELAAADNNHKADCTTSGDR